MARQSLSPMKEIDFNDIDRLDMGIRDRVGRKRKDTPMTHLKYLRKRSGYTLETLSEITSISISYLSRLEAGSRRLNTDLIKRLSHAFRCDPAELLQEAFHDSSLVAPIEFSRTRKSDLLLSRENSMPLYCITHDADDKMKAVIRISSPTEWKQRPAELVSHNDLIALRAGSHFVPHFSSSSTLYIEPSSNLVPESLVVILNKEEILIKKIWSVTPTTVQLCDMADITLLKAGELSKDKLLEVELGSVDVVYKVVGYSDFSLI